MKKLLLPLLFLALCPTLSQAQLNLSFDYALFNSPDNQPYIECYLSINGSSLNYQINENQKHQAKIEVSYIIQKNDSIVGFKKFQLLSPEYIVGDVPLDIIDLKRIPLQNGQYQLEGEAKDLNSGEVVTFNVELDAIDFSSEEMSFSDVIILNSVQAANGPSDFNKSGVEAIPNVSHFYGASAEEMAIYFELYHSDIILGKEEAFLMEYGVFSENGEKLINNLSGFKRMTASTVIPHVQQINIKNVPSGNYQIIVKVKNKQNEVLLSNSVNFQRSNPNLLDFSAVDADNSFVSKITDIEVLKEYINSTSPISSYDELQFAKNQLEYADLKFMQRYFLNFWKTRNPTDPESEWKAYQEEVKKVDKSFGYGGVKGYQTERGRVYLQYGAPNAMQKMPYEPNTYPYSVWQYYKLNGLANRKFIFYSPSMEMLGYQLLHSNVPGEIQNPNWQSVLENKTVNRGNTYEDKDNGVINDRAKDLFDNPR